jgi:hypothetical protein
MHLNGALKLRNKQKYKPWNKRETEDKIKICVKIKRKEKN